jgi:DNA polymerase-3 subunit delta
MSLEIWRNIKGNLIKPIYLLYGIESFLISETKELLVKKILNEEERDFNLSTYDLEETPIEEALEDAETFPFFGEKRIVIMKNPTFLISEKEKIEHNTKKLEEYIQNPSPYTVIVFIAPYEKLDERKKLTKILKKQAEVLVANPLKEKDMIQWINQRSILNNVTITPEATKLLLRLTSQNLMLITHEIEKLSLYVGENSVIKEETVHLLVVRTMEQNIFELIDKVVHRDLQSALRIFYDLLQNNEEPIKILSLLTTQFRLIYQVKHLAKQGYGQQQIATHIKVHPFRVKLAQGQAKLFGEEELHDIMKRLAEADFNMKNGRMEKRLIIELFLLNLQKTQMA